MRLETHQEALYRSAIAQQECTRLARAGRQDSATFALALQASNPDRQQIPTNVADRDALRAQRAIQLPAAGHGRSTLAVVRVQPRKDDLFTVVAHVVFTGTAGE